MSLVLLLLSEILSSNEANYCGQEIFYSTNGTIKTNPTLFDRNVSCLWTLHPPHNRITTIRILRTGLDKCIRNYPCCLSVLDQDSTKNYLKICKKSPNNPIMLSVRGNKTLITLEAFRNDHTWIDFVTRESSECRHWDYQCYDKTGCYNSTDNCNRDFTCSDHSDKVNCGKCPINLTPCDKTSRNCFDPISQRCDGVIHCPRGEDELGCSDLCPNMIRCPTETKCIKQDQLCNSKADCSDSFDEKDCSAEEATSVYFSMVFIISSLCSMSFLCIVFQWISTRRGTQRFLNNPPDFPLAPFEGPGDQDRDSSSSEIFTDSEFRQGGGIYESYLQSVKKTKPITAVISNTRQLSYMDLDGDNELIVLASLNVPVDMCVGLAVSEEKLNLKEALTQERLKNLSKMEVDVNRSGSGEASRCTEIRGLEENPEKISKRCSEKTFIVSDSSEWTDISTSGSSSSRIIYVKSAKNT